MTKNIEINIYKNGNYEILYPKTLGSLVEGNVSSANSTNQLTTSRNIITNLSSTNMASFNGTKDITPGVTGILSITNGGTNSNTKTQALINLGITYGTTDLTPNVSYLESGTFYFVYE